MLPLLFRIVSDGILGKEETRVGFGLWAEDVPVARFVGVSVDDLAVRRVALALFDRLYAARGAFAAVEEVRFARAMGLGLSLKPRGLTTSLVASTVVLAF